MVHRYPTRFQMGRLPQAARLSPLLVVLPVLVAYAGLVLLQMTTTEPEPSWPTANHLSDTLRVVAGPSPPPARVVGSPLACVPPTRDVGSPLARVVGSPPERAVGSPSPSVTALVLLLLLLLILCIGVESATRSRSRDGLALLTQFELAMCDLVQVVAGLAHECAGGWSHDADVLTEAMYAVSRALHTQQGTEEALHALRLAVHTAMSAAKSTLSPDTAGAQRDIDAFLGHRARRQSM